MRAVVSLPGVGRGIDQEKLAKIEGGRGRASVVVVVEVVVGGGVFVVNRTSAGVVAAVEHSRDGFYHVCKGEFRGGDASGKSIGDGGELHRRLDEAAGGPFSLLRHERSGS